MVYELTHQAIPLACALLLRAVLPVLYQPHLIDEAQDVGELPQQVNAVSLETIVTMQRLV